MKDKREVSKQCKKCIGKQKVCNKTLKEQVKQETQKLKLMALFK